MIYEKVTHILFDLDGLLIESEAIYEKIARDIAKEFGKKYTKDVKIKVMGTPEPETARIIIQELELPLTPEEFLAKYEVKVREDLKSPKLMPGAENLIRHFHENGIPIAIATSSRQDLMEMKIMPHRELFDLFDHFVCSSSDPEVKQGKPAPDIYLVCASRFPDKPDPFKCLVFEDAVNGVKSALRAGMQVVMVPDPDVPNEQRKQATLTLNSLEDFQPELFGLPSMACRC
ncbi:unnamed protein product [Phaedon cochleariae]|uniref:pseudouridine 5'-phosphatase n=1 Tax=Phaedon cochleariae TaxID=80249 RepID=A0A9P0DIQ7_PHACE|nr:unnamed protein product [Phaedon cochleariae]